MRESKKSEGRVKASPPDRIELRRSSQTAVHVPVQTMVTVQESIWIHGLKEMIKMCKDYACEFDIMFNPKKSKLMCYNILADTEHIINLCRPLIRLIR